MFWWMDHFEIDEDLKHIISFRFIISQDLVESIKQTSAYYLVSIIISIWFIQ